MKDLDALLSGLLGLGLGRRRAPLGGLGRGLAGGLLGSLLLRRNARRIGGVRNLGALAAIGALAWRAWSEARGAGGGTSSAPRRVVRDETVVVPGRVAPEEELPLEAPPEDSGFVPATEAETQALGVLLLRAMVAAAHSDGRLDADEDERLRAQVDGLGLDPEDRELLLGELRRPVSIEALATAVRSPEEATQVYTASLLAIEPDSALERSHLRRLAAALRLDAAVVARLDADLGG